MSEETVTEKNPPAQQEPAAARQRTRTPKQDPVLAQATDLAREAVTVVAGAPTVGRHLGVDVHEDRLLTHLFDCLLPGYRGWTWYAAVARAPRSKHVSVCEVGLLAGQDSLLAPPWLPWEQRVRADDGQHRDEHPDAQEPSGRTAAQGDSGRAAGENGDPSAPDGTGEQS